jgi:hypothetical protein
VIKAGCNICFSRDIVNETLINSDFPSHMDVMPFSVADKPLKNEEQDKIAFYPVRGPIIHG